MAAESPFDYDEDLDVRGLNCPLPILRTKQRLRDLPGGVTLRIRATDPHSVIDFRGFCDKTEHRLVQHHETDGVFIFYLEKG